MPDQRDQPGEDLPRVGDPAGRTDPPGSRTQGAEGVISRRSPYGVEETVRRLRVLLDERDITLFAHINHAEAARDAGLPLRETQLLLFGSPRAGTPLMVEAPLIALDLPLKVLVWQDDGGVTRVSHQEPEALRERYGLPADLGGPLGATDALVRQVTGGS